MNILIYSDCFIFGGSENVIENLIKANDINKNHRLTFFYAYNKRYKDIVDKKFKGFKNIHAIHIVTAFNKWGYSIQLSANKLSIDALYIRFRYLISLIFEKLHVYDIYNYYKLKYLFKKIKPDILLINNGGYPGAQSCRIAVLSAKAAGIENVIFNVNNLSLQQKGFIDKWIDRKINSFVKVFVTASKAAGRQLVKQRNFYKEKCINIPNTLLKEIEKDTKTVDLRKEFNITNEECVVIAAGMLTARKGFSILIEALNLLANRKVRHFKLIIFGEGEERRQLENQITKYNLNNIIFMPGHKSYLMPYIKSSDIFVCPSVAQEDFPYVIIEAMMSGKPVIGTEIAGIPEQVIDGYNGFIVPPNNVEMLANALQKMLENKELIKRMGDNGKIKYKEEFANEKVIQRYNQLFYSIMR